MMKKQKEVDKIDFEELVQEYKVQNVNLFVQYLKEIFRDLAERSDDMSQGLTNITFSKYYELPGMISQRLFAVLDADNNGYLDIIEFIEGLVCLFSETYEKLAKFIFNLFDFDKDQLISKEDVRTVLSYVPITTKSKINSLKSKFEKGTFTDRVESQEELHSILEKAFEEEEYMDFSEFLQMIENVSSDIFLFILIFLYENRPFTKKTLINYELAKSKITSALKMSKSPMITSTNKLIASPNIKNSKFMPTIAISKSPIIMKKGFSMTSKNKNDLLMKLSGVKSNGDSRSHLLKYVKKSNSNIANSNSNNSNTCSNTSKCIPTSVSSTSTRVSENTKTKTNSDSDNSTSLNDNQSQNRNQTQSLYNSLSKSPIINNIVKSIPVQRKNRNNLRNMETLDNKQYFSINNNKDRDMIDFPITPAVKYKTEGKMKTSSKDCISELLSLSLSQLGTIEDDDCDKEAEEVLYEGYLYKITNTRKLKKLWFKLLHKDLYCKK